MIGAAKFDGTQIAIFVLLVLWVAGRIVESTGKKDATWGETLSMAFNLFIIGGFIVVVLGTCVFKW